MSEGQAVSFILRDADDHSPDHIDTDLIDKVQMETVKYWSRWIGGSKYSGRWDEVVTRSLFILKMLIFEPTGAIVAAPTFSLPEDFGGMHASKGPKNQRLTAFYRWTQLGLPFLVG